jgi:hypothetical protein
MVRWKPIGFHQNLIIYFFVLESNLAPHLIFKRRRSCWNLSNDKLAQRRTNSLHLEANCVRSSFRQLEIHFVFGEIEAVAIIKSLCTRFRPAFAKRFKALFSAKTAVCVSVLCGSGGETCGAIVAEEKKNNK